MSDHPVEALLRPPLEYYSAVAFLMIAFIAYRAPDVLMMTQGTAYVVVATLLYFSFKRFSQGHRIRRYQKGLRRLKPYTISSKTLPVSDERLFLGLGFSWDGRHTQRLANLSRKEGIKYKEPTAIYQWARRIEIKHEKSFALKAYKRNLRRVIIKLNKCQVNPLCKGIKHVLENNPLAPLPPVGGEPSIHAVGLYEGEHPVYMPLADRVGHTLVLGTTRVGKTRLAEILIAQDIHRGDVVIVFDPKGDADLFKRMYIEAKNAGRLDNFHFFHLGYPDVSARYNPLGSYGRITEIASRIAGQLPGSGQSAAFREFVWRYVNVIAKALQALSRKADYNQILAYGQDLEPLVKDYMEMLATKNDASGQWKDTVKYIEKAFNDSDNKEFRVPREMASRDRYVVALVRYCKDKELFDTVASSLSRTFEYDRGYFDKLVSSLLPLMEKLTTGDCAVLLSPDYLDAEDTRTIFSWPEIMRTKGVVYIGLDALVDPEVSAAVGNSMFSDLTSYAGQRYKHGSYQGLPDMGVKDTVVSIHADEFNELIGDEFIPLLNKAGGAGYQVTAYTQTWSDVEARLQDKAKAGQVAGNFNTLLMLRVRELATAEMLTKQLQQTEIDLLMTESGVVDSSNPTTHTDFISSTRQRNATQQVDLLHPNHVMTLPKGQCFALLEGGKLSKIRLPLSDPADFSEMPKKITMLAQQMKDKYNASSDNWYDFTASWPAQPAVMVPSAMSPTSGEV